MHRPERRGTHACQPLLEHAWHGRESQTILLLAVQTILSAVFVYDGALNECAMATHRAFACGFGARSRQRSSQVSKQVLFASVTVSGPTEYCNNRRPAGKH